MSDPRRPAPLKSGLEITGNLLILVGLMLAAVAGYVFVSGLFGAESVAVGRRGTNVGSTSLNSVLIGLGAAAIFIVPGYLLRIFAIRRAAGRAPR